MAEGTPTKKKSPRRAPPSIPRAEWALAAIGAILVIAALAILIHRGVTTDGAPPDLVVERGAISEGRAGFRVEAVVRNHGGSTAEDVVIRGVLRRGGDEIEESEASIPYVPVRSERRVVLVFGADPRDGELSIVVRGYVRP